MSDGDDVVETDASASASDSSDAIDVVSVGTPGSLDFPDETASPYEEFMRRGEKLHLFMKCDYFSV